VQSCARSSSKAVCVLNVNIAPLASVSSLFNCVVVVVNVNGCLTPLKSALFWTPSPMSGSSISRPPSPSLPCLFQSATIYHIILKRSREAALRACCALLIIHVNVQASIHLRLHNHCNIPVPYLLKRVINVQRVTCVTNDMITGACQVATAARECARCECERRGAGRAQGDFCEERGFLRNAQHVADTT